MYAIIKIGKKQYKIEKNKNTITEKINKNIGEKIKINYKNIILLYYKKKILYKKKDLKKYIIKLNIIKQIKSKKINIIKFKRRKNYKRKYGHRQKYTIIKPTLINNKKYGT